MRCYPDGALFSFKLTIDWFVKCGYNDANKKIPTKPLRKKSTLAKPGLQRADDGVSAAERRKGNGLLRAV